MGSIPRQLSLDVRPTFIPKTISEFLGELTEIGSASEKLTRFDDLVKRLEDEMRKIDAFKRELPLCMILLNDGSSDFRLFANIFCSGVGFYVFLIRFLEAMVCWVYNFDVGFYF